MVLNQRKNKKEVISKKKRFFSENLIENWIELYSEKIDYTLILLMLTIMWITLSFFEHDQLLRVERESIFLFSRPFFDLCFAKAGGFLTYAGCFLTQFLFIPWLGSLILVLLWALIVLVFKKVFNITTKWNILTLIPVALLVAGNMSIGYLIFKLKTPGIFFTPTLGFLFMIMAIGLFKLIKNNWIRVAYIAIWTFIGYALIGFYALPGTLAMALINFRQHPTLNSRNIISVTVAIISIALSPFVWASIFQHSRVDNAYIAQLPSFPVGMAYFANWAPHILLIIFTICMAALYKEQRDNTVKKYRVFAIKKIALIALIILGTWGFWLNDANFKAEIKMEQAVRTQNWEKVLEIHRKTSAKFENRDTQAYLKRTRLLSGVNSPDVRLKLIADAKDNFYAPTRAMVLYKNLALIKLRAAGNQAFTYKDGGKAQKSPELIPLVIQCSKPILFSYGLLNFCYRWCMENSVEYGWSVDNMKYAAQSSLLSGNYDLADKYINLLKKTLFHKKWANNLKRYTNNPALITESDEYCDILDLVCDKNWLDNDQASLESYLLKYFTTYQPDNGSLLFYETAMLWAMYSQDINTFWRCFSNYINSVKNITQIDKLPKHYQEAALLYGNLEHGVDISRMIFNKDVVESYTNFNRFAALNPVPDIDELSYTYHKKFGKTFFYFYYFIRNIRSY
ncbi:MAG TPA: DUF6057 family protein [Bacteroidaceae bacterium]|nr:DUF6057 family protein [Bacteroidaceae bacterium]